MEDEFDDFPEPECLPVQIGSIRTDAYGYPGAFEQSIGSGHQWQETGVRAAANGEKVHEFRCGRCGRTQAYKVCKNGLCFDIGQEPGSCDEAIVSKVMDV